MAADELVTELATGSSEEDSEETEDADEVEEQEEEDEEDDEVREESDRLNGRWSLLKPCLSRVQQCRLCQYPLETFSSIWCR